MADLPSSSSLEDQLKWLQEQRHDMPDDVFIRKREELKKKVFDRVMLNVSESKVAVGGAAAEQSATIQKNESRYSEGLTPWTKLMGAHFSNLLLRSFCFPPHRPPRTPRLQLYWGTQTIMTTLQVLKKKSRAQKKFTLLRHCCSDLSASSLRKPFQGLKTNRLLCRKCLLDNANKRSRQHV